ncbi:MAG: acyl-CoA thioesterase [Armatimonadota bacterium]|nr:acyl-CoA thioesterase [Armatimonadota bacterium]MDR7451171.1 acyl-CoA thioesterase [Armatimonadota bacterium]MDR7467224.1 acyl-CoA thioesterase [Armatimonadota bacterium]MDR7494848.1 acyl-CoA thioesterase [Armatimonadota bacterium]MDR7500259.1 acyl-CoA thioesterase [Armatimonadota bacterium]
MPSIAETTLEMVQLVLPGQANVRGTLYGGMMMHWITTAATMAAMRVARGSVVLGSMDDLDFVAPVSIGDLVTLRAQVEDVGRSSLEIGVEVHAEDPRRGLRRLATASHLAMVAVDDAGRPRPVETAITPADREEEAIAAAARQRRTARKAALADRREPAAPVEGDEGLTHAMQVARIVFPEDAVLGTMMFAGRLMMHLDEAASILALRYCRGPIVTASIDALAFHAPIRVGEIVIYQAALNYVGRSSMEIGVRVLAEHPLEGRRRHTCTAFLTMVHMTDQGPQPVPPFTPRTEAERRRWAEAEQRRASRQARRQRLREAH